MSNNLIIGFPNRIDDATLSGGSWLSGLPLNNVKTQQITQVARSADDAKTSTKLLADLGSAKLLRTFALVNHNLSAEAKWRITLGSTSGGSDLYDSDWINVWRMTWDDDFLQWESDSWWIGLADDEYLRHPFAAMQDAADWISARYLTIEIDDTANADGYVQIGRVFAGSAFQPYYNAVFGLKDAWVDLSTVQRAESGTQFVTPRRRYRQVEFALEHLTEAEATKLHEMLRKNGLAGEVLYMPYPEDLGASQRYGFLGRLSELNPINYPYYKTRALPFRIQEIV